MSRPFVFIVTTGRSGSTLLQGILNAVPGVLVRGENFNFFNDLRRALADFDAKVQSDPDPDNTLGPERYAKFDQTNAFYGFDAFIGPRRAQAVRALAETLLLHGHGGDVAMLGFKEIRYFEMSTAERRALFSFLRDHFAPCHFLHLTRAPDHIAKSAWFRDYPAKDVVARITAFNAEVEAAFADLGLSSFRLDYQDLLENGPRLAAMHAHLGLEYDRDRVASVLGVEHSYQPWDVIMARRRAAQNT